MHCNHCGKSIQEDSVFCVFCGRKIEVENNSIQQSASTQSSIKPALFYSREWKRRRSLEIASIPHFDILIDDKNMTIIKLPRFHGGTAGLIIGLFLASLLGAAIGNAIGNSSDKRKREDFRRSWIDIDDKFLSRTYEDNVYLQIPKEEIKNSITPKGKKAFLIDYKGQKLILKNDKTELGKLGVFLQQYLTANHVL